MRAINVLTTSSAVALLKSSEVCHPAGTLIGCEEVTHEANVSAGTCPIRTNIPSCFTVIITRRL
jgi:hypothetical protein